MPIGWACLPADWGRLLFGRGKMPIGLACLPTDWAYMPVSHIILFIAFRRRLDSSAVSASIA